MLKVFSVQGLEVKENNYFKEESVTSTTTQEYIAPVVQGTY